MLNYDQNNPHHCYDLLEHTVGVVENTDVDGLDKTEALELRIAALYHDIGKVEVASEKEGRTVFYNHARVSAGIAERELRGVLPQNISLGRILFYIGHHDDFITFKNPDEITDDNPYIVPITVENVYKKIISTTKKCAEKKEYVPTVADFRRLIKLCKGDASSQSRVVYREGAIVDTADKKLWRLTNIGSKIDMILRPSDFFCDLHTHSTASDGTDTPEQLVEKAVSKGLGAIALTDHNTVKGLKRFTAAAKKKNIDAVAGIEISSRWNGTDLHILGLFIDEKYHGRIKRFLSEIIASKEKSNRNIIERLRADGYEVDWDELVSFSKGANINRAVIGRYLVEKGVVTSLDNAFATVLSKGGGYYEPSEKIDALDAIRFLRSIHAVPVLAHPFKDLTSSKLREFVSQAREAGLVAIEVYYSTFTPAQVEEAKKIALENGLAVSGGSDYHGEGKKDINLRFGKGDLEVSLGVYISLIRV